eukprot:jgi/Botrbrau1/2230/Bobra.101_2s0058.1
MVIGVVEGSLSKLRDITNHVGRSKAAHDQDAATPRKLGEPKPASPKESVLDILPNPAMEQSRSLGAHGRVDSWSLPNTENGMRVTFQNITYEVQDRGRSKGIFTILHDVSAYFSPLQMTAVMGPSGSGKSTLLDLLAGRKTIGEMKGQVLFAGATPTKPFLRRYTGYVEQNDTLLPELTVREMLLYTAGLSLPRKITQASKVDRVDRLVADLGLESCQNTLIGDPMSRGISGGQCKRANIGVALVSEPRVLFLDEPTSGLDSYTAHQVMEVVKSLVKQRITICATIHCPPPQTFNLFESVLILQKGRVAYFGASGSAAINYFHSFHEVPRKEMDENVAEWIIHITTDADRQGKPLFVNYYRESSLKKQNDVNLEAFIQVESSIISDATKNALATKKGNTNPLWWSVWVMLRARTPRNYTNLYYLFGRLFDKTVFTFLLFTFYWRVGTDESAVNMPNIVGALFMWVVLPAFGAGPYLPGIVLERPVYLREMQDGLYGPGSYLTYKMIEEFTMGFIMSIVFSLPTFYICQFAGNFAVFWLAWLISLYNGIAFAYAAAALSPTMDIASAMLLTVPTALLFATGYVLRYYDIPRPWIWLVWINWMWYGFGALMINQFGGTTTHLMGEDTPLVYYSLDSSNEWLFLFASAVSVVVLLAICYAALTFVRHQKR